jgi:hypothetical protein
MEMGFSRSTAASIRQNRGNSFIANTDMVLPCSVASAPNCSTAPSMLVTRVSVARRAPAPMISDLDIWRAANLLIRKHGADAELEARTAPT